MYQSNPCWPIRASGRISHTILSASCAGLQLILFTMPATRSVFRTPAAPCPATPLPSSQHSSAQCLPGQQLLLRISLTEIIPGLSRRIRLSHRPPFPPQPRARLKLASASQSRLASSLTTPTIREESVRDRGSDRGRGGQTGRSVTIVLLPLVRLPASSGFPREPRSAGTTTSHRHVPSPFRSHSCPISAALISPDLV